MKKVKNNWFNRLFHKKKLNQYKEYRGKLRRLIGWCPLLIQDLKEAETLEQILDIHKKAWNLGFQNPNLAPLEWGMFRTKSIPEMTAEEVYLGDIWGLATKNIPFWNENREETMAGNSFGISDDTKIYDIILKQYRNHLISNIQGMARKATEELL